LESKKTHKEDIVIIDEQLVHILRISKWKGFHKIHILERMNKFMGFTGYALRRGYFSFLLALSSQTDSNKLNVLTGHSSLNNAYIYTRSVNSAILKSYKSKLRL